jgi:hypothetical protein
MEECGAPCQIGLTLTALKARAIPRSVARGLSIFCLLAAFLSLQPEALQAAPMVQIRDRVDIEMGAVTRVGGLAQFQGRVVERAAGSGAVRAVVRIEVNDESQVVRTDTNGNFSARFYLPEGEHLLAVDFSGDENLDAAHFEMANFDISKIAVSLSLSMPSTIADDATELRGEVMATTGSGSAALRVDVFFGSADAPLKKIDSLDLDAQGRGTLLLSQQELGGPGRKRIELRYPGSRELDSATASHNLIVSQTSSLTLITNRDNYDYGDTVVASGRLLDGRGNAIEGGIVSLQFSNQSIGQAKTDSRGDYVVRIDTDEIGSGTARLQARYAPLSADGLSSLSKPVRVSIGERKPIPIAYTITAFALASFALLSFVTLRTKPWKRWQHPSKDEDQEGNSEFAVDAPPLVTGFAPGRKKLRSTIGRVRYTDFHGRVRNVITSKGIEDATIFVASHREQELRSDEQGRFAISELSEGEFKITVGAHGFVSEHFSIQIPHRGEFHDAVVDLLPVREKIFSLYKYAVRSLLPDAKLWGIWTPRQILNHVRKNSPSVRLAELTDFVEESFFSQRIPTEEMIDLTRAMIRGLDQEPTGPGPQP